ncbi:MAG: hypothetical protein PHF63_04630 [Herbinix sp.]|nr:hypothetical protein [Herbinix sp.]
MSTLLENEKELTIDEFVESLVMEDCNNGVTLFKITENFQNHEKKVHLIRTIEVEEEDGVILFYDSDGVIVSNRLVIGNLVRSCIQKVSTYHQEDEVLDCYKLYFNDGLIVIQPIVW